MTSLPSRLHPTATEAVPRKFSTRISVRQTVWHILKETPAAQEYLKKVYQAEPEIAILAQLAREFFRIVRQRDNNALTPWIEATKATALSGFAAHLAKDKDAVQQPLHCLGARAK